MSLISSLVNQSTVCKDFAVVDEISFELVFSPSKWWKPPTNIKHINHLSNLPEGFIVTDVERLLLGDEIIVGDIDDRHFAVGGDGDFFAIHCSMIFKWIFSWMYPSRNSGCSVRYALTELAVNGSVLAVERKEREKQT